MSAKQLLASTGDVSDVLSRCLSGGGLILDEEDIDSSFFDLSTGIAGELMQKVVNYRGRLAVAGAGN